MAKPNVARFPQAGLNQSMSNPVSLLSETELNARIRNVPPDPDHHLHQSGDRPPRRPAEGAPGDHQRDPEVEEPEREEMGLGPVAPEVEGVAGEEDGQVRPAHRHQGEAPAVAIGDPGHGGDLGGQAAGGPILGFVESRSHEGCPSAPAGKLGLPRRV